MTFAEAIAEINRHPNEAARERAIAFLDTNRGRLPEPERVEHEGENVVIAWDYFELLRWEVPC